MKNLYESIHDTDIEANVKFPIYITYVLGHGVFKTEEYQVVYNEEQAEDIVAELHAQGFNASYDTVFADEDWDFDKDADETDYGAEWDAEATERFENRYMDGGNGYTADINESDKDNFALKEELGRNVPPIPFENTDDGYYFFDDYPDATDEDFRKAKEEYNKRTGYEEELSDWYKREYGKSIEEIEAEHEAERKALFPNEYLKRDWEKLQKEPLVWAREHWSDAYTKEVEEYGKSLNESSQDDFDNLVDDIYEFYKQWDPYSLDIDEEVDKASIRKALSDPDEDMNVMFNIQEILKDAGDEDMDFKELGDSIIRRMRVDDSISNLDL